MSTDGSSAGGGDLLRQIKQFQKAQLHKTQIRHTTEDGVRCIETIDGEGNSHLERIQGEPTLGFVADNNPDLQVGEILPQQLYIGSVDAASELPLLQSLGITHILNVASMNLKYHPDVFTYSHIGFMDIPLTRFTERYAPATNRYISESLASGGRVFVHCMAGISRASTTCIAYLMAHRGMSFDQALALVKEKRPSVRPNDGFMEQLKRYEVELRGDSSKDGVTEDGSITADPQGEQQQQHEVKD